LPTSSTLKAREQATPPGWRMVGSGYRAGLADHSGRLRPGKAKCRICPPLRGWPASKTLEVAQEMYDGQGKKIITYPRAEARYLP
jgi:hypothetical protein